MIYQKDSSKAEEFIHHEEILDTLEYHILSVVYLTIG